MRRSSSHALVPFVVDMAPFPLARVGQPGDRYWNLHVRRTPTHELHPFPSPLHDYHLRIEPHLLALRAIARGIVGSDDLAHDAVQETLLCLWAQDEAPTDLRGWLVRTTVHKSLHVARSRDRRRHHEASAGAQRSEICPLCDPSNLAEADELRARLDSALCELSEELRAVFLLREKEGLDYDGIARALAVPIGTVRSRLKRARAALLDRMIEQGHLRNAVEFLER